MQDTGENDGGEPQTRRKPLHDAPDGRLHPESINGSNFDQDAHQRPRQGSEQSPHHGSRAGDWPARNGADADGISADAERSLVIRTLTRAVNG